MSVYCVNDAILHQLTHDLMWLESFRGLNVRWEFSQTPQQLYTLCSIHWYGHRVIIKPKVQRKPSIYDMLASITFTDIATLWLNCPGGKVFFIHRHCNTGTTCWRRSLDNVMIKQGILESTFCHLWWYSFTEVYKWAVVKSSFGNVNMTRMSL